MPSSKKKTVTTSRTKRKKISKGASAQLLRAYSEYDGNWDRIAADEEIKALKIPKESMVNQLKYIRNKKNKQKGSSGRPYFILSLLFSYLLL
jgi:hypothetical protein